MTPKITTPKVCITYKDGKINRTKTVRATSFEQAASKMPFVKITKFEWK